MDTSNPLRSFTRLVVGGLVLGLEELQQQLHVWEQAADQSYEQHKSQQRATVVDVTAKDQAPPAQEAAADGLPTDDQPQSVGRPALPPPAPTPADTLRYALIGFLFDSQQRVDAGVTALKQFDRAVGQWADPLIKELQTNSMFAPARARFEEIVTRGESEVARWVELGREEEARSQALTTTAMRMSVETSIHQVAINPEVQELVQAQGAGLANEVVEEVRERAVSADTLVERLARSIFRRAPREHLPEPPAAVRLRAEHIRSTES